MTAILTDRSARLRMTFSGEKARESLGGLVTNDVTGLMEGHGQRAAALTAKGRIIAVLRIFNRGSDLLVDSEAETADAFVAMIRKYVNPRLARYDVVSDAVGCLGLYGAHTAQSLAGQVGATAADLEALPPFGIWRRDDEGIDVVRSADLSIPGFDVFAAPDRLAAIADALRARGARDATAEELERLRIEAGLPRFGVEIDGDTLPQEANLDVLGAISFTKGCYTGQEVVARIHFRGHVNRHLRWLHSQEPLAPGAAVLDAESREVGEVRSATVSPQRGPLAIAMIRREVAPGSTVRARLGARELPATVEAII